MPVSVPSTTQSELQSAATVSQTASQQSQAMTTTSASNITVQNFVPDMNINTDQQNQPQDTAHFILRDRCAIWQGILEFQAKSVPTNPQSQRVSHTLPCTFSSKMTNGALDVNADTWPDRLMLQLIPRQLVVDPDIFNVLKTAARHVMLHFNPQSEALSKLCTLMNSGRVGCIQFPPNCGIRIMVVLYMPDKEVCMGFIPNDQDTFFRTIKQMYEDKRKEQQEQRDRVENVDEQLRINVHSILDPVSEAAVTATIQALRSAGLESLSDLEYIREEDLILVLNPVQRRKLIYVWSGQE